MTTALGLLAVLALILANGYFVAAEFAFVAVRKGKLEEAAAAGDGRGERALAVLRQLSFVLSGAQLGITATSLIIGYIAEPTLGRAIAPLLGAAGLGETAARGVALTIGFVLATVGQMVLGELGPKNLALAEPERFALALARSTALYTTVAGPLIKLFDGSSNRLLRALGIEPVDELSGGASPEELALIIRESSRQGTLDPDKAALLSRALEFRTRHAGDTMVARPHVMWLQGDASCSQLRQLATSSGHSRFPVVGEGLDDVKGVVQAKDVLGVPPEARDRTPVRTLLQPVVAVPETALLGPLLAQLRRAHTQLAVVVDEHGGTAGIVTLEDIVEELVGTIRDEHDPVEPAVQHHPDGGFTAPGFWRVDELERDTGVQLPEGDYDTVGGFVMAALERLPAAGDRVELDHATLVVDALDGLAVALVTVRPAGGSAAGAYPAASPIPGTPTPRTPTRGQRDSRTAP